jgi:shikimate kinase
MNIFLIGYRCSGKTSVGRQLAHDMRWTFLDTDHLLVEKMGMDIARVVEQKGWGHFRKLEQNVIKDVCQGDLQVIATGGGAVLYDRNVAAMKESGIVVWLKIKPETVKNRMAKDPLNDQLRPSLTGKPLSKEIQDTLLEREPYYRKAMDFFVETDVLGIEEISKFISSKTDSVYKG